MALHHSEETHQMLVAKVPSVTGRPLQEWFQCIDDGPTFSRFDDRVRWLRDEYGLAHGHATAIVHERDLWRSRRSFS